MMRLNPVTLFEPRFGETKKQQRISLDEKGKLKIPNHVAIPAIAGDGIGPEIMPHGQRVVETAVKLAYGLTRSITWIPLVIGEKALAAGKKLIPDEVLETLKSHHVFVKGPVNTPSGGGFRSVNVGLRKELDLYACVRPVKVLPGVVTPMKEDKTDVVIFRENTEDVYRGIEFPKDSALTRVVIAFLNVALPLINKVLKKLFGADTQFVADIREDSGIGIKPISEHASKRLVKSAIQYALDNKRPSVTLVGKANIMKYTEGAFMQWGKEVAHQEFPGRIVTVEKFWDPNGPYKGNPEKVVAAGKVVLQERLTDAMFQDVILSPQNHSVVATMNLNGDYLSDAFAATVGGLGVAPGANIGDTHAMFESTHGSAPDIAGKNIANPTALMLTMAMMLDHIGWKEAASLLQKGLEKTLAQGQMTGDLARKAGKPALKTDEFTNAVIENMQKEARRTQKPDTAA